MVSQAQSIGHMFHLLPLTRHVNSKLSRACEMSFPWLNKRFYRSTFLQCYNNERGKMKLGTRSDFISSLENCKGKAIPCCLQCVSQPWGIEGVREWWAPSGFHLSEEGRGHQAHNKRFSLCQWQELEHLMGHHSSQSVSCVSFPIQPVLLYL